jgi:hypothetical protein
MDTGRIEGEPGCCKIMASTLEQLGEIWGNAICTNDIVSGHTQPVTIITNVLLYLSSSNHVMLPWLDRSLLVAFTAYSYLCIYVSL